MAFKKISKKHIVANTPEELLNDLKTRKIPGLLAHQADILRAYYDQHDKQTDIALQLPTGSGKTLVGLLIAEWRRRKYSQRVVYLCPTRQLVYQAVAQARDKYGLSPIGFVGKQREYPTPDKTAYSRAEAVAITTYSAFFCQPSFFKDAETIILDDVHAADNYIANAWTLEVKKFDSDHKALFGLLAGLLRTNLPHSDYVRIVEESDDDPGMEWVEKIPTPIFYKLVPDLIGILDKGTKDLDIQYEYRRIRDSLLACHMYLSSSSILIRPVIPPTKTHKPFINAIQRVYMSATLGIGGELERLTGVPSIARLAVSQGWDKHGIGRRFFIFPELSLDEDNAMNLTFEMVEQAKRALFLVPSTKKADAIRKVIDSCDDYVIFDAKDLEVTKDRFIQTDKAIALLANRYDGIDFIDDECRLLVIVGISRAANLQERFLVSRMCSVPLYIDRIITRIVQATGRCTRSPNDYSAVVILNDDFAGFLMKKEKIELFHPELQAEIEFGIQQSRCMSQKEFIQNLKVFLKQGEEWKEADSGILEVRNSSIQRKLPAVDFLKKSVAAEVEYQYAMWNEDYSKAVDYCREVLGHLSGDDLKGYRAFWNYLAGSAAWLGSQKRIVGLDKVAQDFYQRAANIAPQIRWLISLTSGTTGETSKTDNPGLIDVIERLEAFLEKCGTVNNQKFDTEVKKITDLLTSTDSKTFEKGHELLGNLIGFKAGNEETTAAPDPWWIVNDKLCIIFEDDNPEKMENCIGVNKVRQAESHPKWVREHLELQDSATIIPVMISPRSQIDKTAVIYAGDVRFWHKENFLRWAISAISVVRDLRRNFPGRGDIAWRAEAFEVYKNNNIAPMQLINNILKQRLKQLKQI